MKINGLKKIHAAAILGMAVGAAFLLLSLRNTDVDRITESLARSNLWFGLLIAASLLLQFLFKALRWQVLLRPFATAPTMSVYQATVVGYLANLVFPLYMGEIARIYILCKRLNLRYSSVFATVVLERVFDFLTVLFIVGSILVLDPLAPKQVNSAGLVAGTVSLILLAMLFIILWWQEPVTRLLMRVANLLPTGVAQIAGRQLELAITGLQSVRSARNLVAIVFHSLLQWAAMGLCIYFGMVGTHVDAPVSAAFVVLALIVLGVTLPSSPGFFGTIQLCFALGLAAYGVDASQSFSSSVFFHLTIYATGWIAGIIFLRRSGESLGGLRNIERR